MKEILIFSIFISVPFYYNSQTELRVENRHSVDKKDDTSLN
jgi:hypothetical protein